MTTQTQHVPERIARLRHYGRFPVPITVPWDARDVPDFTAVDVANYRRVVLHKLCGICGEPLDYYMAFIGGPRSMTSRCFSDPAMHVECAEYAVRTCPYLGMRMAGFVSRPHRAGSRQDTVVGLATERPDRFGLLVTRGFKVTEERSIVVLRAGRVIRIDWYVNGAPDETQTTN